MDNKAKNIPTPEELGIPSGSLDPMKTIAMEGDFYRGLGKNAPKGPVFLRVGAILFGLLFFVIPGLVYLFLVLSESEGMDGTVGNSGSVFYFVLWIAVGVVIIWDNLRKHKIKK